MTDITDRMQNYRECVRHIWNTHFQVEAERCQDWDLRDDFCDAALILFRALVLQGLDVGETELLPDSRAEQQPLLFLRPVIETSSQVLINRTGASGYWDDPVTQLENGDCELRFIQFFDWWLLGFRDFAFYRVRIVASPRYPHLVGRDALVPVTSNVKVLHDTATSGGPGAGDDRADDRDVPADDGPLSGNPSGDSH